MGKSKKTKEKGKRVPHKELLPKISRDLKEIETKKLLTNHYGVTFFFDPEIKALVVKRQNKKYKVTDFHESIHIAQSLFTNEEREKFGFQNVTGFFTRMFNSKETLPCEVGIKKVEDGDFVILKIEKKKPGHPFIQSNFKIPKSIFQEKEKLKKLLIQIFSEVNKIFVDTGRLKDKIEVDELFNALFN